MQKEAQIMNQQTKELTLSQLRTFINSKEQHKEFNIEIDLSHYNNVPNEDNGETRVNE